MNKVSTQCGLTESFFKPKNKIVCKQQNSSWKASLGTRLQNAETCASKEPTRKKEAWMVKPLSAVYVKTVVAC